MASKIIFCSLLLAVGICIDGSAQVASVYKIGAEVRLALRLYESASVIVSLVPPLESESGVAAFGKWKSDLATVSDGVLATLDPASFQLVKRFEAVPAFAGRILLDQALLILAANANVSGVHLDLPGGGGGSTNLEPFDARSDTQAAEERKWTSLSTASNHTGSIATHLSRNNRAPAPPPLRFSVPLIRANQWHERGITGKGVIVAVIDSGIETAHSDLSDDLVHEECFLEFDGSIDGSGRCPDGSDRQTGPGAAEDDTGHGTNVTGIITARGIKSSVGVAPDAGIVSIKVLDSGNRFRSFSELIAALNFVIQHPELGIGVINMSLGTDQLYNGSCDSQYPSTAAAVSTLRNRGVLVFASSMNNGSSTGMGSPACLRNVIAVGATDNADAIAGFSNASATLAVLAPGVRITSTGLNNNTSTYSGTSQASPHAAGCAALLLDAQFGDETGDYVARIRNSTVHVNDFRNNLVFPRLDCRTSDARVQLTSLTSRVDGDHIVLDWEAGSNSLTTGFEVLHRSDRDFARIAVVDLLGAADVPQQYSYSTPPLPPGQHLFQLNALDAAGGSTPVGEELTVVIPLVGDFYVSAAYPNPFSTTATINLAVRVEQEVSVQVFNLQGRRVATLYGGTLSDGVAHTLTFDATTLSSGVYMIRAWSSNFAETRSVTVAK